jgi:hypothetical protein
MEIRGGAQLALHPLRGRFTAGRRFRWRKIVSGATGDAHPPKQPLARQAAGRIAGRVDQCLDLVSDPRELARNAI